MEAIVYPDPSDSASEASSITQSNAVLRARRGLIEFVLLLCLAVGSVLPSGMARAQAVTIKAATFYKNGTPWILKGIDIEAFNEPGTLRARNKIATAARSYWGPEEFNVIRTTFGADTLRITVSQPGLDPQSPIYEPDYFDEVLAASKKARAAGFVVILAMDAQAENGIAGLPCMPNDSTVRAWKKLALALGDDRGIAFELFNEPCKPTGPADRAEWASGMQAAIETVRGLGAKNILFLDGLHFGRTTSGLFPLVHDTMPGRLALAVHPYLSKGWYVTETSWEREFGAASAQYPTVVTEWNATPTNGCVDSTTPDLSLSLMRYLQRKRLGLVAWAIDSNSGKLVRDHIGYQPTDFADFRDCKDGSVSGAGKLFARYPNN